MNNQNDERGLPNKVSQPEQRGFGSASSPAPCYTSAEQHRSETLTDVDGDVPNESSSDEDAQTRAARNERPNRRGTVDESLI